MSASFPTNTKVIGRGVRGRCSSLTGVDMSSLVRVECVGEYFLSDCSGLVSIKFPPNVWLIGAGVLQYYQSLICLRWST